MSRRSCRPARKEVPWGKYVFRGRIDFRKRPAQQTDRITKRKCEAPACRAIGPAGAFLDWLDGRMTPSPSAAAGKYLCSGREGSPLGTRLLPPRSGTRQVCWLREKRLFFAYASWLAPAGGELYRRARRPGWLAEGIVVHCTFFLPRPASGRVVTAGDGEGPQTTY